MSEKTVEYAQKLLQQTRELGFLLEKKRFLESQAKSLRHEYERKRIGKKEYESLMGSYSRQTSPELEKLGGDILAGIAESKKCLAAISLVLEGKQVPLSLDMKVDAPVPLSLSLKIGRPEWHGFWARIGARLRGLFGRLVRTKTVSTEEKRGWTLPIVVQKEIIEKKVFVSSENAGEGEKAGLRKAMEGVPVRLAKEGERGIPAGAGFPVNIAGEGVPVKAGGKGVPVRVAGGGVPMSIGEEKVLAAPAGVGEASVGAVKKGFFSRLFSKKKPAAQEYVPVLGAPKEVVAAPPQQKPSLQSAEKIEGFAQQGGIRKEGFFERMFAKGKKGVSPEMPVEEKPDVVEAIVSPSRMEVLKTAPTEKKQDFSIPAPPKLEEAIRLKDITPPPKIGGEQFRNGGVRLKPDAAAAPEVKFKAFKLSIGSFVPKVRLPSLKLFSGKPTPLESKPVQKLVSKVHITREKRSFTAPRKSLIYLTVEAPATYQALANRLVGWMVDRMPSIAQPLFWKIHESGMRVLHRTYLSVAILTAVLLGFFSAVFFLLYKPAYLFFSVPFGLSVFGFYYATPFVLASNRRRNIDVNLPFAIHHMAAIASSGVSPYVMFRILTDFTEYGEISKEATKIIRHVDVFGQDILFALKEVTAESPSKRFAEFLNGITSTIETGGDLRAYLQLRAREAIFEYEIERRKYVEALSTYADFFTVILVAAPLFLVAILTIISMLGSNTLIMGFAPAAFMTYATYIVLPAVHLAFLGFLSVSQPEV